MIAGAGGQFLASPTDLVKIRLQVEGRRVLEGHLPRSAHIFVKVDAVRLSIIVGLPQ